MARIDKTVFISHRRTDRWQALAVFKDLTQHGYDVFIDYDGIASGDFERAIVDNIRARAHFIVVLTPTALERCDDPADWLRREIEVALETKRNVVPLLFDGFRFNTAIAAQRLQGSLEPVRRYQALEIPEHYFDPAMERLRSKYLAVAVEAVLHFASAHAQQVADEQHDAASKAAALAPAEAKMAAHSAPQIAPQRTQGQAASVATNEGQAVSPASIVSSGGKKQVDAPPSATAPRSDGATDAAEQWALGRDYYFGENGRTQNAAEAVKWFRKAAEQGNAYGQASLGEMYVLGLGGLAKDPAQALKLYRQAAAQGHGAAKNALARMGKN